MRRAKHVKTTVSGARASVRVWLLALVIALSLIASQTAAQTPQPAQLESAPDAAWWAADAGAISKPRYAGVARTSVYVPVRDGVRLALDVYLPRGLEAGARLPTILEQTRYHRSQQPKPDAPAAANNPRQRIVEFVTRGYAYVVADVRGSGASFGVRRMEFSEDEVRDGGEIIEWITRQLWSNGKVGATGVSYVGTTAELLVTNRHPAVKAAAPLFSLYDAYTDIAFPGGLHQTWFSQTWQAGNRLLDTNQPLPATAHLFAGVRPVDADGDRSLLARAVAEHAGNVDVHNELSRMLFRDDRSSGGWTLDDFSPFTRLAALRASNIPIYSYSGWFDGAYAHSAIKRFRTVKTPGSRLVLGPWNHGGAFYFSPRLGARRSSFDHTSELLRFFDHHLKGLPTSIERDAPVRYYTTGEERWKSARTFPVPNALTQTWYFAADNALTRSRPMRTRRNNAARDEYRVDQSAGSGTQSRWNTLIGGGMVAYTDRAIEDRKLLTYTSAPLDTDVEVTGFPVVTLFVDSTATDGSFFVYLEEVSERGEVRHVTEGILRAVHRKLSRAAAPYNTAPYNTPAPPRTFLRRDRLPLVPGEIAELTFELIPTSHLFRRGSRLRVAVAGADKDHFAPVPAEAPTIGVHRSRAYASRIVLPVVPR